MPYLDEVNLTQAEYYMQECFNLAKKALGRTSPNPVVGAIVLDKEGIPVGRGCHEKAGEPHAEVFAIKEANERAQGGTLITNLEPCCHIGKTPPCTDLIIKSGIKTVIFSNKDPNLPFGKSGEEVLTKSGVNVISNILQEEGKELNKFFFKWVEKKIPWITLKQAQTLDGKIALESGESKWISSELSRKEVHKLRNIYDAILVSSATVIKDDPELTVREINGGRNPVRIILDSKLRTDPASKVFNTNAKVILVITKGHSLDEIKKYESRNKNLIILELLPSQDGLIDLNILFKELGKYEILSVLVEAGPKLASKLVLEKLIDEYILFISPKIFGDSNTLSSICLQKLESIDKACNFKIINYKLIGNDLMLTLILI